MATNQACPAATIHQLSDDKMAELIANLNTASAVANQLALLPRARQAIILRKRQAKSTLPNVDRDSNREAFLGYLVGTVNQTPCVNCSVGHGPCVECVSVSVFTNGQTVHYFGQACTNCRFNGEGTYCSMYQDNNGMITMEIFERHAKKEFKHLLQRQDLVTRGWLHPPEVVAAVAQAPAMQPPAQLPSAPAPPAPAGPVQAIQTAIAQISVENLNMADDGREYQLAFKLELPDYNYTKTFYEPLQGHDVAQFVALSLTIVDGRLEKTVRTSITQVHVYTDTAENIDKQYQFATSKLVKDALKSLRERTWDHFTDQDIYLSYENEDLDCQLNDAFMAVIDLLFTQRVTLLTLGVYSDVVRTIQEPGCTPGIFRLRLGCGDEPFQEQCYDNGYMFDQELDEKNDGNDLKERNKRAFQGIKREVELLRAVEFM